MNSRDTRWTYGSCALICAVAALLVASPPAAAVNPAVNEYSLNFPDANGKSYPGAETPTARPSELPPPVRMALERSPNGKALATIATSPALGASATAPGGPGGNLGSNEVGTGETPSALTAIFRTLDDPAVLLGLLALLALVGLIGFLVRFRRETSEA